MELRTGKYVEMKSEGVEGATSRAVVKVGRCLIMSRDGQERTGQETKGSSPRTHVAHTRQEAFSQ